MDVHTPKSTAAAETLESDNQRLRAQVADLEAKLATSGADASSPLRRSRSRRMHTLSPETEDRIRDIPSHASDEADRIARGLSYAIAEGLRSTSDVISSFADELFGRTAERRAEDRSRGASSRTRSERDAEGEQLSDPERATERVSNATDDLLAGLSTGIHASLETPRRVIERFFDEYDSEPSPRSATGRTGTRTRSSTHPGARSH